MTDITIVFRKRCGELTVSLLHPIVAGEERSIPFVMLPMRWLASRAWVLGNEEHEVGGSHWPLPCQQGPSEQRR